MIRVKNRKEAAIVNEIKADVRGENQDFECEDNQRLPMRLAGCGSMHKDRAWKRRMFNGGNIRAEDPKSKDV